MATTSQSNQTRHQLGFLREAIDAATNAGAINAGDLVYETGAGVASLGNGPLVLNAALVAKIMKIRGISKDQNPLVGGTSNPLQDIGIYQTGEFAMNTTAADVYTHLAPVTVGADAQTITLAPVPAAPVCALNATAASAVNGLANAQHSVALTWITAAGETTPGPATNGATTLTAGGTPSISVTVPAFPAYAIAAGIYIDGMLTETVTAAGAYVQSGFSTTGLKVAPIVHALAIGYAYMPLSLSNIGGQTASVAGGVGVSIGVRLNIAASPIDGLI